MRFIEAIKEFFAKLFGGLFSFLALVFTKKPTEQEIQAHEAEMERQQAMLDALAPKDTKKTDWTPELANAIRKDARTLYRGEWPKPSSVPTEVSNYLHSLSCDHLEAICSMSDDKLKALLSSQKVNGVPTFMPQLWTGEAMAAKIRTMAPTDDYKRFYRMKQDQMERAKLAKKEEPQSELDAFFMGLKGPKPGLTRRNDHTA